MRGTQRGQGDHPSGQGIIPAYAGNTSRKPEAHEFKRDHPRICGEHISLNALLFPSSGSSPHMRGTLLAAGVGLGLLGIIPAYAGNTFERISSNRSARDHPRICGEHYMSFLSERIGAGSSPHMRGTPNLIAWCAVCAGIIPAYAGNTIPCSRSEGGNRDHPRICGEHVYVTNPEMLEPGSSPHMRGTPGHGRLRNNGHGIIPAYAGNTAIGYRSW